MLAALISVVGASLLAVGLLARRVAQLGRTQSELQQSRQADRSTQAAFGHALQTLQVELNRLGSHTADRESLRDAQARLDTLADAHRALERRWGLEHARSLARDGIAPDLLVREYGLTAAEARLIARLEPAAAAH